MCLIMNCVGNRPSEEYIENGEQTNGDGTGIAWSENGYLRYEKDIDLKETKRLAATLPLGYVIHFRIASVGPKDPRLIHPFPVSLTAPLKQKGKANKLLFHNGHYSEWKNMLLNHLNSKIVLPSGIWSDTRAIALLTAIHGKSFLKVISGSGSGNWAGRLLLMTPTQTSMFGDWQKEDGVYYSNSGYKLGTSSYSGAWSGHNSHQASSHSGKSGYWRNGVFVQDKETQHYLGES